MYKGVYKGCVLCHDSSTYVLQRRRGAHNDLDLARVHPVHVGVDGEVCDDGDFTVDRAHAVDLPVVVVALLLLLVDLLLAQLGENVPIFLTDHNRP